MTCGKTLQRCRRNSPRKADMSIPQTATPRICAKTSRSTNAFDGLIHSAYIRRHPCADVSEGGAMDKENRSGFMVLTCIFSVELPGIEPGSYGIPSRLLRAQSAMPLLESPAHANKS